MDQEDVEPGFQNEEQFWDALEETVSQDCASHSLIDDALRSYLGLVAGSKDQFEEANQLLSQCAYRLATSPLFEQNAEYIRRQFIHSLLQEDDPDILLVTSSFLLADAQMTERVFELLNEEGAFPRLVNLITEPSLDDVDLVRRLIMQMLYEMSRIQRITTDDLACVSDQFVEWLFDLIEQVSGNVNDPYHYPVIRVLLVLNEQFMVAAHEPKTNEGSHSLTNKVVKVLSAQGNKYKTFGENIILLLNREDETSLQLLTLKLLYLLFTTPQTYEYFYTNDLRVLVDILIRNLLDLPEEATSLRHTYLRVFYPLLENTQLQQAPHYKQNEIMKLLTVLGGGHVIDHNDRPDSPNNWSHFEEIDETTKRLVTRCKSVSWLTEAETDSMSASFVEDEPSGPPSPISPSKPLPPALPAPRKLKKRNSSKSSALTVGQYLDPHLESARQSSLSMVEVATQKEKPGVITPSRNAAKQEGAEEGKEKERTKPDKPPPPKARRSGWGRLKTQKTSESLEGDPLPVVVSPEEIQQDPVDEVKTVEATSPVEQSKTPTTSQTTSPTSTTDTSRSYKKPPPAPKARRWQFKRSKDSELTVATMREPGKFDAKLPSIKTDVETGERSPFSPVEEKTLSPSLENSTSPKQKRSVSQALEEAQAQAVQSIDETMEGTTVIADGDTDPMSPVQLTVTQQSRQSEPLDTIQEGQPHHPQAVQTPGIEITRPPRAVLAPPNPAPIRSVPGPMVEMERSPFLSDAEVEEGSDEEGGGEGKRRR